MATAPATPILNDAAPRGLCTDCGVSRMADPSACGKACQFIKPDYPTAETTTHGRPAKSDSDERFFGVTQAMYRAALTPARAGAQWTGLTTSFAERLLETGAVDAVLTMVPDDKDKWRPRPAIITNAADMKHARGMRMGYAPLLALLEPAREAGHRKIAVIGIPCQIYALRAMEADLGFDRIYVIGTPCSDNTTTENFHSFLARLTDAPDTVTYLEFRADYHVELRFSDGSQRLIPFLKLPLSDLPPDFFPTTCRTCVDYTNRLADITVGYMAGEGDQWLIVRNDRGAEMLKSLGDEVTLAAPGSRGNRTSSVKGFVENTRLAAGGLPLRRMPNWLRGVMGWLMPRIGPRGLEFARARLEMKAAETIMHLRREEPAKIKNMVPTHVWNLARPYGLTQDPEETAKDDQSA
ncbi:Coenzyme F420 hydrogenase/dehydrogenase, beta subunit C-terminal domain [Yoonia sp. F2084L]|uniref:Coenzyme F420 hydrogenase/dehydrogenase, beta subunit C-terminal domain n=1 Tax=Yoonia sp. F2084L TaxID=2926419 RepID=UPI001FF22FB5|nr:Coenzyme F420 hydrogenase/dehydrogenase, beta subunit C-terminal domain [Yoonia sp. F2084L]MCK0095954.1 Coenzyme F420 hydrogenase/dehydrogenase, beta subunit C-terminal domain [Yoonia sp. F2084L]